MKRDKYMGLDVHQATTVVAVQDAEGKVVFETIVETEGGRITRLLEGLSGPIMWHWRKRSKRGGCGK